MYPLTVQEIADVQLAHPQYKNCFQDKTFKKDPDLKLKVISKVRVIVYKRFHMVITTTSMQTKTLEWYHHYLQHPDDVRMTETLVAVMYWKNMRKHIAKFVKT